jgi:Uma2 family endonuclease
VAAATQIPVEEYLRTSYRPDRDYVDGEVLERNLGEYEHARPQGLIYGYLLNREKEWRIRVVPEQRVQVRPSRFRVPDICVVLDSAPVESIFRTPPFLCIEVLSKDDSFKSIVDRLDDYAAMGVANIWVVDPHTRRGYSYAGGSFLEVADGVLRTANPEISVPLSAIFE